MDRLASENREAIHLASNVQIAYHPVIGGVDLTVALGGGGGAIDPPSSSAPAVGSRGLIL